MMGKAETELCDTSYQDLGSLKHFHYGTWTPQMMRSAIVVEDDLEVLEGVLPGELSSSLGISCE
jgi:hypothetical protein